MITNKEKELLVRGILTNSINNNIYSWKTEPEPEIADLFLKFAREDPTFLLKALLIYQKHGVIENLKYYALAALAFSGDKESFKRAFRNSIKTPEDIYNFSILLDSNDSDNYGFRLDGIAKDLLRQKLEKITELDLLPYFVLKKNREKIKFSELRKLLNPTFNNPLLKKAIQIIFGKETKKNIVKNELPILWGLQQIKNEKEPTIILKLIKDFNIPFKWALAVADLRNSEILEPLLARVQATDLVVLLDVFFKNGYFREYLPLHLYSRSKLTQDSNESFSPGPTIMNKIITSLSDDNNINLPYKLYVSLVNRPKKHQDVFATECESKYGYSGHVGSFREFRNKIVAIFIDHSSSSFDNEICVAPNRRLFIDLGAIRLIDAYAFIFMGRFGRKKCHLMYYMDKIMIEDYQVAWDIIIRSKKFRREYYKGQSIINKINNPLAPFYYLLKTKSKYDIIMIFTDYDYSNESIELWKRYREQVHSKSTLFIFAFCNGAIKRKVLF
jgi:hypothetical protein